MIKLKRHFANHSERFQCRANMFHLVILLLITSCLAQESLPHSPCPNVFYYVFENGQWNGRITLPNDFSGSHHLEVNASYPVNVPNYVWNYFCFLNQCTLWNGNGKMCNFHKCVFFGMFNKNLNRENITILDFRRLRILQESTF